MAKDDRLYARFDIAMDEHPKIALLSDAGFRALVEATMYSRRQMTDGFLAAGVALKKWGRKPINELCSNDPERPSLFETTKGGVAGYQIHDFEKHQTTTADIERKREAGRLGGLAKASKPVAGATDQLKQNGKQTSTAPLGITETETETVSSTKRPSASRGSRLSPDWLPSPESVALIKTEAPGVDAKAEHRTFVDYWIAQPGQKGVKTNWDSTWRNWMRRKQEDIKTGRQTPEQRARQTMTLATDLIDIKELTP